MTDKQIKVARELCDSAPPGPWNVENRCTDSSAFAELVLLDAEGRELADTGSADYALISIGADPDMESAYYWNDGPSADALKFAAEARTLLPAALDEIDRLRWLKKRRYVVGPDPRRNGRFIVGNGLPTWPDCIVAEGATEDEAIDNAMAAKVSA